MPDRVAASIDVAAMARSDDDTLDPRLNEFVEILAQALVLDYRRQLSAAEKQKQPDPIEEALK